jgi:hypothetical protein
MIGAGTLSKRVRNHPPAFNEIRIEGRRFETLARTLSAAPVREVNAAVAKGEV